MLTVRALVSLHVHAVCQVSPRPHKEFQHSGKNTERKRKRTATDWHMLVQGQSEIPPLSPGQPPQIIGNFKFS